MSNVYKRLKDNHRSWMAAAGAPPAPSLLPAVSSDVVHGRLRGSRAVSGGTLRVSRALRCVWSAPLSPVSSYQGWNPLLRDGLPRHVRHPVWELQEVHHWKSPGGNVTAPMGYVQEKYSGGEHNFLFGPLNSFKVCVDGWTGEVQTGG